jgi:predicted small secreted protein
VSGVSVIRTLLASNAAVIAVVPADRILAGDLPINFTLPAIQITQISGIPTFLDVAMAPGKRLQTDRVQVMAVVKNTQGTPPGGGLPALNALLALVLSACPNTHRTVDGTDVDSILPDSMGPDLSDDAFSFVTQSRDFIVRFSI